MLHFPSPPSPETERAIMTARPSPLAFVGRIAVAMFAAVLVTVLLLLVRVNPLLALAMPFFLIVGITSLQAIIRILATEYKLTTQRFFVRRGLIARQLDEIELFRVKDVRLAQGPLQRVLDCGNVWLISADDSSPNIVLHGIPHPADVKERIRHAYRNARIKEGVHAAEFIHS